MPGRGRRIRAAKTQGLNTGDTGEHRVKRFSHDLAFERNASQSPPPCPGERDKGGGHSVAKLLLFFVGAEVEQDHQIADVWAVRRVVGAAAGYVIRELVTP